jgi:hypothetical protein
MEPKHLPKQVRQGIALVLFTAFAPLVLSVLLVVLTQLLPWVLAIAVVAGVCRVIAWRRNRGW